MPRQTHDDLKHIRDDFAVRRMVAQHRGDEAEVRRIGEDIQETRELLGQCAVRVIHGARPGETFTN